MSSLYILPFFSFVFHWNYTSSSFRLGWFHGTKLLYIKYYSSNIFCVTEKEETHIFSSAYFINTSTFQSKCVRECMRWDLFCYFAQTPFDSGIAIACSMDYAISCRKCLAGVFGLTYTHIWLRAFKFVVHSHGIGIGVNMKHNHYSRFRWKRHTNAKSAHSPVLCLVQNRFTEYFCCLLAARVRAEFNCKSSAF